MKPLDVHNIDNYLSGTATPEEKAMVEAWLQTLQEGPSVLEKLPMEEKEKVAAKMWTVIANAVQTEHNGLPDRHREVFLL